MKRAAHQKPRMFTNQQRAYVHEQQDRRRKEAAELSAAEAFLASKEPLPVARVTWWQR